MENTSNTNPTCWNYTYSGQNRSDSDNSGVTCEDPEFIEAMDLIETAFTFINVIVAVGILFGQSSILISFVKYKFVRTPHNALLLNLSMSDLLSAPVIIAVNVLTHFFKESLTIKVPCLMTAYLYTLCYQGQIWGILLVTIDRWTAVYAPFKYHVVFSWRNLSIVLGVTWATLILVDTGCAHGHRWSPGVPCYAYHVGNKQCVDYLEYVSTLPPLIVIPILYLMVVRFACVHRKNKLRTSMSNTKSQQKRYSGEIKTVRTLTSVLAVLYLSRLPAFVLVHFVTAVPTSLRMAIAMRLFTEISITMFYLGSLINPLIYHRSSPSYRKAFRLMHKAVRDNLKKVACVPSS